MHAFHLFRVFDGDGQFGIHIIGINNLIGFKIDHQCTIGREFLLLNGFFYASFGRS
ncbi:Uncharacterised protein [Vibrio cholerae]|nr:Uncharacterised protein [Vibrio cholerae]